MIESFLSTTFAYDAFQRAVSQTDGSRVKFTAAPRIGIAYASKRD
jgi:hypothetical protein